MPSKPNLLTPFRKNIAHGKDFRTAMRGFDKPHEACLTPQAGASFGQLVWHYAGKAVRTVGREVLYATWIPLVILMQVAMLIVCSLAGLTLLLWLIHLL